jgi:hypothetical protein
MWRVSENRATRSLVSTLHHYYYRNQVKDDDRGITCSMGKMLYYDISVYDTTSEALV